MFKSFGFVTLIRGTTTKSNGIRNKHSFDGFSRFQSSFTFLNNQSLLQKEQVKQSKRKNRKSIYKIDDEEERSHQRKRTVELSSHNKKLKRYDYSWLPRVPSTGYLKPREMSTRVLYSGYRPLFISPDDAKVSSEGTTGGSTLYEFAMKFEELGEQSPWMSSATGLEFYSEWDNVPADLQKSLKPFNPPETSSREKNLKADTLKKLKQQIYLKERDKILNRGKGRKKPVVALLQLRKKLKQDD